MHIHAHTYTHTYTHTPSHTHTKPVHLLCLSQIPLAKSVMKELLDLYDLMQQDKSTGSSVAFLVTGKSVAVTIFGNVCSSMTSGNEFLAQ